MINSMAGDLPYHPDRGHHCAELRITADPKKPLDKGWPAER